MRSIPDIPFIDFKSVFFQKPSEFILIVFIFVMGFLALDVRPYIGNGGLADAEGAVFHLPRELFRRILRFVDPSAASAFDIANHVGNSDGLMKIREEVDVVLHPADFQQRSAFVPDNPADVLVHGLLKRYIDQGASMFGGENHVITMVTVAHAVFL